MFVSPRRNHSSSTMIERRWSFLVVRQGKALRKIVAVLPPENGERARARAVAALHAVRENVGRRSRYCFMRPI